MPHDKQKVDAAVLALLALWAFKDGPNWRSWKGFDWEVTERLFEAGFIHDPKSKARSVVLTEEGLERGLALCEELFDLS
jgi:hypothetical protein